MLGEKIVSTIKGTLGYFSPSTRKLPLKRKEFYQSFVHKNNICFDVGANIGNRIEPLLQIGAKIIAIEPQESCCKILKKRFGNRIKIINKGLGAKEWIQKFYISNASTLCSFSDEWIDSVKKKRFRGFTWWKTIDTELTTLDYLIDRYGVPTFIKIDVEGYESEVLRGLSHSIPMISFEYTVPEQTSRIFDCINSLYIINNNILCNYSIWESMEWVLEKWLTKEEFLEHINKINFIETGFGDIYVKTL